MCSGTCDCEADPGRVELVERSAQRQRAGVVDVAHSERVEHDRARRSAGRRGDRVSQLRAEVDRVRVPERRREQHDQHAAYRGGLLGPSQRRPARRARDPSQHMHLRARAEPCAVEDRERHRHTDALFDAEQRDGQERDQCERELDPVEAGDRPQFAHTHDPRRDEQQNAG